ALKKRKARIRKIKRIGVFTGMLALIFVVLAGFTMNKGDRNDSLAARKSDIKDNGLIRVYLKSLSRVPALGMTLDGAYTVDGDAASALQGEAKLPLRRIKVRFFSPAAA
ncbi:MAG: hypothetical protein II266_04595, partial [Clostridia bacterium]|nr:hypothetical protein [Clostridia bacterium]